MSSWGWCPDVHSGWHDHFGHWHKMSTLEMYHRPRYRNAIKARAMYGCKYPFAINGNATLALFAEFVKSKYGTIVTVSPDKPPYTFEDLFGELIYSPSTSSL